MINLKNNRKTIPIVIKQTNRTNGRLWCNCHYSKLQWKQTKRMLASIQEIKILYCSQQSHRKFQFYAKLVKLHWSDMVFPPRLCHSSVEASKKISEQLTSWSFLRKLKQHPAWLSGNTADFFRNVMLIGFRNVMLSNQHHNQNHPCHCYWRSDDATPVLRKEN